MSNKSKNITTGNWKDIFKGPYTYDKEGQIIFHKDGMMLDIRGWGYLTGQGALGLPQEEAMKIQDQMGEEIAAMLNKSAQTEKESEEYICQFLEWIGGKYNGADLPELLANAPKSMLTKYKSEKHEG